MSCCEPATAAAGKFTVLVMVRAERAGSGHGTAGRRNHQDRASHGAKSDVDCQLFL